MSRVVILLLCALCAFAQDLEFRPMPPDSDAGSTLIWYRSFDKRSVFYWQNELDKFLHEYNRSNNPHADKLESCKSFHHPMPGKVCDVKIDRNWSPCVKEMGYNFERSGGGPCIFLKLNKIFNWVPEYFNSSTIEDDKLEMKDELKRKIVEAQTNNQHKIVWVTCEGEHAADKEHIGSIRYIPQSGFPSQFFPYKNQDGYLSPLVAVYFEHPRHGILINVKCKAWARNIHHDKAGMEGSVHFELMVD